MTNNLAAEHSPTKSTFDDQLSQMRLLKFVLLTLAICHIVLQLFVIIPIFYKRTDQNRDVVVYWRAATNVYHRRPLYRKYTNYGPDSLPQEYDYAPPFAAAISPLGRLSFVTFARLWLVLTIVAFWIFSWCVAKLSGSGSFYRTIIAGLFLGLFPGGYLSIALGQVDPLLWSLFAMGLIGVARPSLWGIAAIIKPYYVWIILAAKHRWKQLIPAIVLVLFLVSLGGFVCGWGSYLFWLRYVLPSLTQGNFKLGNVSLSFMVIRLARLLGWHYVGGPLPVFAHMWLSVASPLAPLLTWRMMRKYPAQIKCAAIATAAALFAPYVGQDICHYRYLYSPFYTGIISQVKVLLG